MNDEKKTKPQLIQELKKMRESVERLRQTASAEKEEHKLLNQKLSEMEAIFRAFGDMYFWVNQEGRLLDYRAVNKADLYISPKEFLGKPVNKVLPGKTGLLFQSGIEQAYKTKTCVSLEYSLYIEESEKLFEARIFPVPRDRVLCIVRNITRHRHVEEELKESEQQYRDTINSMTEAIHVIDTDMKILLCNDVLKEWLKKIGVENSLVGKVIFETMPFLPDRIWNEYRQVFETGKRIVTEEQISIMGKEFITEARKIPVFEGEKVVRIVTIVRDITEEKRKEKMIYRLAYYDMLTGLPNRTLFDNHLAKELFRAERNNQKLALMVLDLDDFKNINDTFGHLVGDRLLSESGKRLTSLLRKSDIVARWGGDEFVLLLSEFNSMEDIEKKAENILNAIREPFVIEDKKMLITVSVGISIYPDDGKTAEELSTNADISMYKVKQSGKNRFALYKKK